MDYKVIKRGKRLSGTSTYAERNNPFLQKNIEKPPEHDRHSSSSGNKNSSHELSIVKEVANAAGVTAPVSLDCASTGNREALLDRATSSTSDNEFRNDTEALEAMSNGTTPLARGDLNSVTSVNHDILSGPYEVDPDNLIITANKLGCGHFGDVFIGLLVENDGKQVPVAVKKSKMTSDPKLTDEQRAENFRQQKQSLECEKRIMSSMGSHPNILRLIGAVTRNIDYFCIITEYCAYGSLDKFLQNKEYEEKFVNEYIIQGRDGYQLALSEFHWQIEQDSTWKDQFETRRKDGIITTSDLMWFGLQIAQAMEFLTKQSILHRDVALRNVLLADDYIVKVADFGLSRKIVGEIYQPSMYSAMPIGYLAPEVLQYSQFSDKSESWAYGIVLWELFTMATRQPYLKECGTNDIVDGSAISAFLGAGKRLSVPEIAPISIQRLIARLWEKDPAQRPSFGSCQSILKQQLIQSCPKILLNDKTAHFDASEDEEVNEKTTLHRTSSQVSLSNFDKKITAGKSKMEVKIRRRQAICIFLLAVAFITIAIATSVALYNILNASHKNNETLLLEATEVHDNTQNQDFISKTLKEFYKKKFKSHNPLYSFLDFEFDMEDGYVPLTLSSQTSNEGISDLDVFIREAFRDLRLAIVIGDPFSGKTTLLQKIAFDWANIGRFKQYDIILFSEFRNLPDGIHESILDFVRAGISEFDIHKNINIYGQRVLILVDGYDEKRQNQICNELDRILSNDKRINLGFDLMLTTRPSSIIKRKHEASFWKIKGFLNEEQQNDYIENHFRNSPEQKLSFNLSEKISAIKSDLKKSYLLRELAKSPMMLTFFCLVRENMKQITKPGLFDAVVKFMIQRFDKKHPEKKILHLLADNSNILPAEFTDHEATEKVEQWREFSQIRKLGKFAFNAAIEKKLVFESNDLRTVDTAVFEGIGLLFKISFVSGIHTTHKYQFVHRTMQEFFSALHFLYWQTDTVQHLGALLNREYSTIINSDYKDFIKMTFDVLMAERKEDALISISPLLSEIEYLNGVFFRIQSQSADELRKEHAFFQSIMENCKKIIGIDIDGMGAAVDFAWTIKLPHDHHGGKIEVDLINFNFVGTNESMLTVNCSKHDQFEDFGLLRCKFEPERLRLTVDGYLSYLKFVEIFLTPEMMEKLTMLPDSRFMPSEWTGDLRLRFPQRSESRSNSNTLRLINASTVDYSSTSLSVESSFDEDGLDDAIYFKILQIFPGITGLNIYRLNKNIGSYFGLELDAFKRKYRIRSHMKN